MSKLVFLLVFICGVAAGLALAAFALRPPRAGGAALRRAFCLGAALSFALLGAGKDDAKAAPAVEQARAGKKAAEESPQWVEVVKIWRQMLSDLSKYSFVQAETDVQQHANLLSAMASEGHVEKGVSDELQAAFQSEARHVARKNSSMTCYEMTLLGTRRMRVKEDLIERLGALERLASSGKIETAVFDKAALAIARDIEFIKITESEKSGGGYFDTAANGVSAKLKPSKTASAAARLIARICAPSGQAEPQEAKSVEQPPAAPSFSKELPNWEKLLAKWKEIGGINNSAGVTHESLTERRNFLKSEVSDILKPAVDAGKLSGEAADAIGSVFSERFYHMVRPFMGTCYKLTPIGADSQKSRDDIEAQIETLGKLKKEGKLSDEAHRKALSAVERDIMFLSAHQREGEAAAALRTAAAVIAELGLSEKNR